MNRSLSWAVLAAATLGLLGVRPAAQMKKRDAELLDRVAFLAQAPGVLAVNVHGEFRWPMPILVDGVPPTLGVAANSRRHALGRKRR